ncbi:MAG: Gfo/Idh/MocA family oxidoreductase [Clostridia bacterium]|nr:Gfo/Idh/MocA family oxidoreductase [Clostridia bacterium]
MLNFGIIGVGRMGIIHAKNIYEGHLKDVHLQAICDIDKKVLTKCKRLFKKVNTYEKYEDMIANEKLDGVIIATPHYLHKDQAIYLINHGVNTLIEKPLYPNVNGIDEIIKKAANSKLVLGVSYNQRSNPLYKKAKELIEKGAIGKINYANFTITSWYRAQCYYNQGGWRGSWSGEGGGALINQCVHQIDILQNILGIPKSVLATCKTVNRNITVENDVLAILKYEDFNCTLLVSNHDLCGKTEFEISGDKGRITIDETSMLIQTHIDEKIVNRETTDGYGKCEVFKKKYSYGQTNISFDAKYGQQLHSLEKFRDAINKKGSVLATINEGLNAVEIINGIYLSSDNNKEIDLPVDRKEYKKFINKKMEEEKNVRR